MATIYYGLAGEGRGHAARARTIIEAMKNHAFTVFAPDQAHDFLAPKYLGNDRVRIIRIPGLRFHYRDGRMDLTRSTIAGLKYWYRLGGVVRKLCKRIDRDKPELIVTDFDPALPRAAEKLGVPYVSLDHQSFLTKYDLSSLPVWLRIRAWLNSLVVRTCYHRQKLAIVSAFFRAPILGGEKSVHPVGPLLRPEIRRAEVAQGNHYVSYLRENTPRSVIESMRSLGQEVRIYGLGAGESIGNLRFKPFYERGFVEDLATSRALIGAAGNQSIGEALSLGKPIFAMPEESHDEQQMNAHFVQQMGVGKAVSLERASDADFCQFGKNLDAYSNISSAYFRNLDGTEAATAHLNGAMTAI
jgi:uncharacterized protein (TIGR00661 family)